MQHTTSRTVSRLLIRWRYGLLSLTAVLVVLALQVPHKDDFDRRVHTMISSESDVLASFQLLKRSFGGNEIVLAVYRDPDLLAANGNGIDRLAQISDRLEAIDGVRSTVSLNKLGGRLIASPAGFAIRLRRLFEGYTHSADGTIGAVVCMLNPESATTPPRRETIDAIRHVMAELPDGLPPGELTGEPVMVVDGFRYVEQDGRQLSIWSSCLMGLTILVCFRSFRWMLICVGVVQLSLLLTRASMSLMGMRMSLVSSMLTAVVTVVGVATVVHIIVRYTEATQAGRHPLAALLQTTRMLLVPVLWACVTDAVGFLSLKSATVGPVGDFGMMMAISCLAVLASVWLLVPSFATLGTSRSQIQPSPTGLESRVRGWLEQLAAWVEHHWHQLLGLSVVTIGAAIVGMQYLEVETDFTRNFRQGSEIVQAYQFVEAQLGGAGVGDILIPAPEKLSWDYLRHIRKLEERIEAELGKPGPLEGLTKVISLADAVLAGAPHLPIDSEPSMRHEILTQSGLALMRNRIPDFYAAMHAEDVDVPGTFYTRVMFRAREQQSAAQKRNLVHRLKELATESFPDGPPPLVTGFFVILAFLIDSLVGDQWVTFLWAIAGIGLTMLIAFRSIGLAIIALVPNALPVLVVSGMMGWARHFGWFDFRINMGSAMIAAVSLGLSIDSSIHYIFAYQQARRRGDTPQLAIAAAHRTVGLAMFFATLALIVGFSVLATSNFTPTVYFGSLVSLTMLGGLLGNLIVLPILLRAMTWR